jgi:hypothetical protein
VARLERLTTDQAQQIHDFLQPATGYLWRMMERIDKINLRLGDPRLYELVNASRKAMHSLMSALHARSCPHPNSIPFPGYAVGSSQLPTPSIPAVPGGPDAASGVDGPADN